MTDNETFIVQSDNPERLYVKTYHDFLDSTIIGGKEKLIFILLKRYLNFSDDKSGVAGTVYPTLDTLSKQSGMTRKTVIGILKKLETKGLIMVKQQGMNKPNIYTLRDYKELWQAESGSSESEEVAAGVDEISELKMIEALRARGYTITKEKGLESEPSKAQKQAPVKKIKKIKNDYTSDDTKDTTKSQEEVEQEQERYTLDQIRQSFDYDTLINAKPSLQEDIDAIFSILYNALNTTKKTIRVSGEDKPTTVVIGKILKLDYTEILYCIEKYHEQTDRIKNPSAYMLTLLYHAKEQMNLDITNQVQHDMYNWDQPTPTPTEETETNKFANQEPNDMQREHWKPPADEERQNDRMTDKKGDFEDEKEKD